MNKNPSIIISCGLIASGLALFAWTSGRLTDAPQLDFPLNPFGVNRSPYGEVFAMALQGPINTNFHVGMYGIAPGARVAPKHDDGHEHAHEPRQGVPGKPMIFKPEPSKNPQPATEDDAAEDAPKPSFSLGRTLQQTISRMQTGHQLRTNPLPAGKTLKFYLRRQAEDKLRLAYQLDPSHYANYNALHFFLIEGITTRPELTPSAAKLAQDTIEYCLSKKGDPRPALTAAAACTNILHLMFKDNRLGEDTYTTEEMWAVLRTLDLSINRYHEIAAEWDANDSWSRISPQRVEECQTRIDFITNIRNAAVKTIQRIENGKMREKQS